MDDPQFPTVFGQPIGTLNVLITEPATPRSLYDDPDDYVDRREAFRRAEIRNYAKAYTKLRIKDGHLPKSDACSICGEIRGNVRIDTHHFDYREPWLSSTLCAVCHMDWHDMHPSPPYPDGPPREIDWVRAYKLAP